MFNCYHPKGSRGGPGTVIMRLSKEEREILRELTSEDTQKMQGPDYYDREKEEKK